ncbi:MAG: hypothetical protein AB7P99_19000 [Vicinamibacterales bacterium]
MSTKARKPASGRRSLFPGKSTLGPVPASLTDEARAAVKELSLEVPCTVSDFVEGMIRYYGKDTVKRLQKLRAERRASRDR